MERLAALLGYIDGLSYWKAFFTPHYEIAVAGVPTSAKKWCQELLLNGMAECAYRNNLLHGLQTCRVEFGMVYRADAKCAVEPQREKGYGDDLLLFSGGKDSLATRLCVERRHGRRLGLIDYNWRWDDAKAQSTTDAQGVDYEVTIRRQLDAQLRELNAARFINGHVPFSAYLGLAGVIAGEACGASTILAGNTWSDDEPNVHVNGWPINHQWSKSLEFERGFRALLVDFGSKAQYECPLRPFSELQVIKFLMDQKVDLGQLRTCNRVGAGWCGQCAKCLWVFIALAALTGGHETERILGFRPTVTESTLKFFSAMAGVDDMERPFECTGTTVEVRTALGCIHKWLLPEGRLRSFAEQWALEYPLAAILANRGPRAAGVEHKIDLLNN
ncbi:MAG: hypothetical protein ACREXR_00815 [Gammaproteobacteria bacterium]